MIRAARKYEQDHGRRHPAAVARRTSRRPSRPSVRARSARSSGSRPGTSRTSARWAWGLSRHGGSLARRLRPLARPRAGTRPFNPNRFHLLFRWYFDYAGGMMSDWGVHLNDIVLWALDAKAPQSVFATGGIFTTEDDRDTPDTPPGHLRVPRLHPHLLDAQGERPEASTGTATASSSAAPTAACCSTARATRSSPTRRPSPTGSSSVHPEIKAPEDRPRGRRRRRAWTASRRTSRTSSNACSTRAAADLRHRDRPPLDQHLPPRQHRLQARAQAHLGRGDRDVQGRSRGQRAARLASRARASSCPAFDPE